MACYYGSVSVLDTATVILISNPSRRALVIQNSGAVTVYIGFDDQVTTANGIPITSGGSYINSGDGEGFKGSIYGIVATGPCDCRYQEWTP